MKYSLLFLLLATTSISFGDWPQWRGPDRNGVASSDAVLPDGIPEDYEVAKKWEFTGIPSDHYGGHGSVSISDGKVFLSIVWHRDEPTETRSVNGDVLSTLGYRGTSSLPKEVVEKMEDERLNLSRRLRGTALDEWAAKWVEDNLDPKTQLSLGSWVISRFKKGKAAISLADFETLRSAPKEFANQSEMEAWVNAQDLGEGVAAQVIAAVPNTKKVASDVVLCLDASTGDQVWRFEVPGHPSGRSSSSTPAVHEGRVYAALSENLYSVDASTGEEIWRAPLTGRKGPASSPLVAHGKVFLQQNRLSAFDTKTGEELWKNDEVKGANQSPAVWKNVILCNSSKNLLGVDAESGATLWSVAGGGDGTPVVSEDHVVVSSRSEGKNLIAYHLGNEGPKELWTKEFLARRYGSSPIVHAGHVYHLGSERHLCIDLKTGAQKWERKASSSISSPILADGKLLVYENRGGFALLIAADPEEYKSLGRTKVGALYCASPALVGNLLFLRTKESVACFEFE
ncbi:MAG: PQQ-binding-like beta-propeller repeat protein [Verrucomicrobiales bacterium]|nr:PQQ-binding-like beta-propeller repeat protein [Verrucomicrobiales bacterium]